MLHHNHIEYHMHSDLCLFIGTRRYSKTCLMRSLKSIQNKGLNGKVLLNEGRKYCRMLPLEHSAILLTCIKR